MANVDSIVGDVENEQLPNVQPLFDVASRLEELQYQLKTLVQVAVDDLQGVADDGPGEVAQVMLDVIGDKLEDLSGEVSKVYKEARANRLATSCATA